MKCVDCSQEFTLVTKFNDEETYEVQDELCDSCLKNFTAWLEFRIKAIPMDFLTEKIMGLRGTKKG